MTNNKQLILVGGALQIVIDLLKCDGIELVTNAIKGDSYVKQV